MQLVNQQAVEQIAYICHEANRAYCESIGDLNQPCWERAPEWQKISALNGVLFHLNGDHGPEASHANWLAEKEAEGWHYGPVKDADLKTHPCFMPFSELPVAQQMKDKIFTAIVGAFKKPGGVGGY